ncbi:hypothetical protein AB0F25_30620 [Streptomyces wedmorensis]|uniref:hypothetical protein n=1 Tax=Streptomyces wedmorensis TaxID=43759 RepID=UPI00341DE0DC
MNKRELYNALIEALGMPEPFGEVQMPPDIDDIEQVLIEDNATGEFWPVYGLSLYKSDQPHGRTQLVIETDSGDEVKSLSHEDDDYTAAQEELDEEMEDQGE